MSPVPVLHLITELAPGGAQTALYRLLSGLNREQFQPRVACFFNGDGAAAAQIRRLDIPVHDLGMTHKARFDAFWRLFHLLRREQPRILHTWLFHATFPGRLLGRLAGVPIIISSRRNVNIGSPLREQLNALTAGLDTHRIAVCELAREIELQHTRRPEQITTIYNGIDPTAFTPLPPVAQQTLRRELDLGTGLIIGAVGRLHRQKGFDMLLHALAGLQTTFPQSQLLLIGEGELRTELQQQTQDLGLKDKVIFAGLRTDVPALLALIDVFVSTSRWEGLPNVVLEAMAAGRPVVATSVGGTPELVRDGETGLLVPPDNVPALQAALEKLLPDPSMRLKMGQAGLDRVRQNFTITQMVTQTESLYRRLLQESA